MVEEGAEEMDKKFSSRPVSVTSRNNVTDCRKENGAGNRHQRNGRRRDTVQTRPSYDNQGASRRPFSQKYKGQDRRPPARRSPGDSNATREVVYDEDAETGSAQRPGSKKGSLNHLLNFSFAPRDSSEGHYGSSPPQWKGRGARPGRVRVQYSKEQFLQANCQFVVTEGPDYSFHQADADRLVDWGRIEQVRIFSNEVPSCPICLYPPVAAKITRCGHIYCWSCILHYLSLGEKAWSKCPICYESVKPSHLKSVVSMESHAYCVGEEITLSLMKREKGTMVAMPKETWEQTSGQYHSVEDKSRNIHFSKILVASPSQVQAIIDAEREELKQRLSEEEDNSLEASFVETASNDLNERQKSLNIRKEALKLVDNAEQIVSDGSDDNANTPRPPPTPVEETGKECMAYACAFSGEVEEQTPVEETLPEFPATVKEDAAESPSEVEEMPVEVAVEELALPTEASKDGDKAKSDAFYFYQASDGQHIYLQSVNARCLVKEYGSLEQCPTTITGKIVEIESITMTPELRGRLRYLSHLPLTCEFKVAELVLRPPVVSRETLDCFMGDIERRRKQRQRKFREEKKRSKKIQDEEDKKLGIYHKDVVRVKSAMHFPECGEAASTAPEDQDTPTSSTVSTPMGSPDNSASASVDSQDGGVLSFAQMLRQGKHRPPSAWGQSVEKKPYVGLGPSLNDDSDPEDCERAPEFKQSFGDAIQDALDKFKTVGIDEEVCVKAPQGGKKKKKKQKTLLFSTAINRH